MSFVDAVATGLGCRRRLLPNENRRAFGFLRLCQISPNEAGNAFRISRFCQTSLYETRNALDCLRSRQILPIKNGNALMAPSCCASLLLSRVSAVLGVPLDRVCCFRVMSAVLDATQATVYPRIGGVFVKNAPSPRCATRGTGRPSLSLAWNDMPANSLKSDPPLCRLQKYLKNHALT